MTEWHDEIFGDHPARPNHPDFWAIAEIVLKVSGRIEEAPAESRQEAYRSLVMKDCDLDLDSFRYLAVQRALRMTPPAGPLDELIPEIRRQKTITLAAMWQEGFVVGYLMAQKRAKERND